MTSQPAAARQHHIIQLMKEGVTPAVGSMAVTFGVSTQTIRRDLKALDEQGKLRRIYGGALPVGQSSQPLSTRVNDETPSKLAIGTLVARLVRRDQWVFISGGSTALEAAQSLAAGPPLRVMTHMPAIADVMIDSGIHRVILTGGDYDPEHRNLVGDLVIDALANRAFDLAILGAYGIDERRGVVDGGDFVHRLKRRLMQQSERTVWLADASKFGRPGHLCTAAFGVIDTVVTDRVPPLRLSRRLADTGATAIWQPEQADRWVDA